jgi:hypothetical protein
MVAALAHHQQTLHNLKVRMGCQIQVVVLVAHLIMVLVALSIRHLAALA